MTAVAATLAKPSWARCPSCGTMLYHKKLARNFQVCPDCGDHLRLTAAERIEQLADPGTVRYFAEQVWPTDPLEFTDSVPYPKRLAKAQHASGLPDAVRCATAAIGGVEVCLAVMDFRFMGGSLGCAAGEMITRAAETALALRSPLLIVTASGGARMQEGVLSLMQMAKVSQAIGQLQETGLLTVSVITDPTYGGVAASYATNCDVVVIESGARMGFAGPRVIEQTIRQDLPKNFQNADFLMRHGQVDAVQSRRELRGWLLRLLSSTEAGAVGVDFESDRVLVRDPGDLPVADPLRVVASARDVRRPTTLEYIGQIFDGFVELHGDRTFGDCAAIVAGFARFHGQPVAVVGHQKAHDTKELVARNFGMPRPEGYRKALRVMRLAAQLGLPVVSLVDTPGAYPGIDAEERGQSGAIAQSILAMSSLPTPLVTVVTGEGGSGGALALAVSDRVMMMADGFYSVISPEGCAAILWGSSDSASEAAAGLRITARDLLRQGVVDGVIPEPDGGVPAQPARAAQLLDAALAEVLPELLAMTGQQLVEARRRRFRAFGTDCVISDESQEGGAA
ncbi:MAG TPA: acetyl-CoA carboxylase carboxyl transferase subunit alpha [Pseudonocardiaceae bacterium]|jgi:acetyl-CoA carboxylase carboxyl transferase subunit beta|nr:acetyl-CoA carboxylase carboxyl transferase subunit alpha [Pseudonocardiaceae bacterium]